MPSSLGGRAVAPRILTAHANDRSARHLQGLRHPRPAGRGDRRRRRGADRPGLRAGALRARRQAGRRPDGRARAGHAPRRARARRALPGRPHRRGRARPGRRDGRDGDALLPRRLAGPRRRADVHRLPQPEGLHGRQARARGGAAAVGRPRHRRGRAPWSPRASRPTPRAAARWRRSTSRPPSTRRSARSSTPPRCARSGSCSTAATAWPGRPSAPCWTASPGWSCCPASGRRTAPSPTTSPTRCWRRTARS